jgi:hypothetical protein
LNDYIEKRQIKIQKSENEYHNTYWLISFEVTLLL